MKDGDNFRRFHSQTRNTTLRSWPMGVGKEHVLKRILQKHATHAACWWAGKRETLWMEYRRVLYRKKRGHFSGTIPHETCLKCKKSLIHIAIICCHLPLDVSLKRVARNNVLVSKRESMFATCRPKDKLRFLFAARNHSLGTNSC